MISIRTAQYDLQHYIVTIGFSHREKFQPIKAFIYPKEHLMSDYPEIVTAVHELHKFQYRR